VQGPQQLDGHPRYNGSGDSDGEAQEPGGVGTGDVPMNRGNLWVEIWSREQGDEVRAVRGELRGEVLLVQAYTAPLHLSRLWSIEDDDEIESRFLPPADEWLTAAARCQELTHERQSGQWRKLWGRLWNG
jgi:hypothetical protein